jgi:DNA-binding PadR family transcriptional regulator
MAAEVHVTVPLLRALGLLLVDPHREWYGSEIQIACGLSSGGVSGIVQRLVDWGWVVDRWGPGRQGPKRRYVRLTATGSRLGREMVRREAGRLGGGRA